MTKKIRPLEALQNEISNLDNVHSLIQVLDSLVHDLLEATKHKHTIDTECGCVANVIVHEE